MSLMSDKKVDALGDCTEKQQTKAGNAFQANYHLLPVPQVDNLCRLPIQNRHHHVVPARRGRLLPPPACLNDRTGAARDNGSQGRREHTYASHCVHTTTATAQWLHFRPPKRILRD
jgi:hypothetical protein